MSNFKAVTVKFKEEAFNYTTSVNAQSTEDQIRKYFVGAMFNMGIYPIERMMQCIDVTIKDSDQ